MMPPFTLGRPPQSPDGDGAANPDWRQADVAWIRRSLRRARALPSGGWYALDATRAIGRAPKRYTLAGRSYVVWRDGEHIRMGPDACPHMGASLADGHLEGEVVTCPWHAWRFRTTDGTWCDNPRIKTDAYEVRVAGDEIQVRPAPTDVP